MTIRTALVVLLFVSSLVLAITVVRLIAAGEHADHTATLTPSSQGLWAVAVVSFVVLVESGIALVHLRRSRRHPWWTMGSALLFCLSFSCFAFDVYWWFAAGSYADMASKQIPASDWKTYHVMGASFLGTVVFGLATLVLIDLTQPLHAAIDGLPVSGFDVI